VVAAPASGSFNSPCSGWPFNVPLEDSTFSGPPVNLDAGPNFPFPLEPPPSLAGYGIMEPALFDQMLQDAFPLPSLCDEFAERSRSRSGSDYLPSGACGSLSALVEVDTPAPTLDALPAMKMEDEDFERSSFQSEASVDSDTSSCLSASWNAYTGI